MTFTNLSDALAALAKSPAYDAALSWDGQKTYAVGAGAKYIPLSDGFEEILTLAALRVWADQHDVTVKNARLAAGWVRAERQAWFDEAREAAMRD